MQFTTRLTNNLDQLIFPLPVCGRIQWESVAVGHETAASAWRTVVNLPDIPKQHIVVPSFACLTKDYQYQWSLHSQEPAETSTLTPVAPASIDPWQGFTAPTLNTKHILGKIDCWHTGSNGEGLQAELVLYLPKSLAPPENDLLTLSIRPIEQDAGILGLPTDAVVLEPPVPVSQMQAQPEIAKRICSPTATTMAVAGQDAATLWSDAVDACYDPNTKAYGKWPLAIYWASQQQRLGAVEALASWQEAEAVLRSGAPIVCSIRFAKGTLPGAPLTQSGGHLVVLYGIEFEQNEGFALVMDPAGETTDHVAQRYPLRAFSDAWMTHRGGAYLFGSETMCS
jgi:hypothetical protein